MGAATNCTGVDDVPVQAGVDSDHFADHRLFACMIPYGSFRQFCWSARSVTVMADVEMTYLATKDRGRIAALYMVEEGPD